MSFWKGLLAGLTDQPIARKEAQPRKRVRAPGAKIVASPPDADLEMADVTPPRTYPVELVGEQSYQSAIKALCISEPIKLLSEPDNPNDRKAIVAVTFIGRRVGYLPKRHWLYDAINFEGRGATAKVMAVGKGQNGLHNVVLEIALNSDGIGRHRFTR